MNTHVCDDTVQMDATSTPGLFPHVGNLIAGAGLTLARFWHEHQAQTNKARAFHAMNDIDAHTLKDIGAPHWMVAEAVTRGDGRCLRLIDLYRS